MLFSLTILRCVIFPLWYHSIEKYHAIESKLFCKVTYLIDCWWKIYFHIISGGSSEKTINNVLLAIFEKRKELDKLGLSLVKLRTVSSFGFTYLHKCFLCSLFAYFLACLNAFLGTCLLAYLLIWLLTNLFTYSLIYGLTYLLASLLCLLTHLLTCFLASLFRYLLSCLLQQLCIFLFAFLSTCILVYLLTCLLAYLLTWMLAYLFSCFLACLLSYLLVSLLTSLTYLLGVYKKGHPVWLISRKPKKRVTNCFFLLQILNTKPFLCNFRGLGYLQNKREFLKNMIILNSNYFSFNFKLYWTIIKLSWIENKLST